MISSMVKRYIRRARRLKKRIGAKPMMRRYRRYKAPGTGSGFLTVKRLNDLLYLHQVNNNVAGSVEMTGTNTNNLVTLGTTVTQIGYGYQIPFAMRFSLNQLSGINELTSVFEQYRIIGVKVFVTYQHNQSSASGTSGLPSLSWYPDYDDSTPVDNISLFRRRMGIRRKAFTSDRTVIAMWCKPKTIFTAGTATVPVGTWYDCQLSGPQETYFGIKGRLENVLLPARGAADPNTTSFRFDVQYTVQFRKVSSNGA